MICVYYLFLSITFGFILDTDTAWTVPHSLDIDDNLAILYLASYVQQNLTKIHAITTTFGNANSAGTFPDAVNLVEEIDSIIPFKIPVGKGGIKGNYTKRTSSLNIMENILENSEKSLDILNIGSFHNLATLTQIRPDLIQKIKTIYMLGGAIEHNLRNELADLNFVSDSKATNLVLQINMPKIVFTQDVLLHMKISKKNITFLQTNTKCSESIIQNNSTHRERLTKWFEETGLLEWIMFNGTPNYQGYGTIPWDVVASSYMVHPEWFTDFKCFRMEMVNDGPFLKTELCVDDKSCCTSGKWSSYAQVPTKIVNPSALLDDILQRLCFGLHS